MSVQSQIDRINQNVVNTYAVLNAFGADMPSVQNSDNLAQTAGSVKAVLYSEQSLTPEQQARARQNIGVGSVDEVAAEVLARLGTPVFGRVDEDNNIILTGELVDGTYTIKYEDANGNVTEIGTVEVGESMPDSGSIELEWSNGVKLDKNTGAEGTGDGYAASQHIELVDGYTYTFNQNNAYGGVNICYYDASGNGLGYELLWDSKQGTDSKALTPIDGSATFRIRMYCGSDYSILIPEYFTVTYEKTV